MASPISTRSLRVNRQACLMALGSNRSGHLLTAPPKTGPPGTNSGGDEQRLEMTEQEASGEAQARVSIECAFTVHPSMATASSASCNHIDRRTQSTGRLTVLLRNTMVGTDLDQATLMRVLMRVNIMSVTSGEIAFRSG
jgi:hypothetical protein